MKIATLPAAACAAALRPIRLAVDSRSSRAMGFYWLREPETLDFGAETLLERTSGRPPKFKLIIHTLPLARAPAKSAISCRLQPRLQAPSSGNLSPSRRLIAGISGGCCTTRAAAADLGGGALLILRGGGGGAQKTDRQADGRADEWTNRE